MELRYTVDPREGNADTQAAKGYGKKNAQATTR